MSAMVQCPDTDTHSAHSVDNICVAPGVFSKAVRNHDAGTFNLGRIMPIEDLDAVRSGEHRRFSRWCIHWLFFLNWERFDI